MAVSPQSVWQDLGPPFQPFDQELEESRELQSDHELPDSEARSSNDSPQMPPPPDPHSEERRIKVKRAPREPTQEERDRHNVSHCPFRSWCKLCVFWSIGGIRPFSFKEH